MLDNRKKEQQGEEIRNNNRWGSEAPREEIQRKDCQCMRMVPDNFRCIWVYSSCSTRMNKPTTTSDDKKMEQSLYDFLPVCRSSVGFWFSEQLHISVRT